MSSEEGVHQGNRCGAIDIIIAVHKDLLSGNDCLMDSFDSLVHVLHEERIVKVIEIRTEERARLLECIYPPLDQKLRQHRIDSQFRRKLSYIFRISDFF